MRRAAATALLAALILSGFAAVHAYSTFAKWGSLPVTFYVNPTNQDVSASAAATAVQYALDVWNTQSASSFRYQYGGTVSDTATAYDNRNVLMFRNASNGSTIATTYSWWDSSGRLLDSDIVVWDANFTFFTGTSGCGVVANAAYLEDIATHELGHALGLNHSSYADATMYPGYSYCSQAFRTLAPDDIAAVQSLYSASSPPPTTNTPPTVVITSPASGATFVQGTTISLAATASDAEDGNLSSKVQWTDNGSTIGSGSAVSTVLNLVGTHTIGARVTDSGGLTGSSQVGITITVLPTDGATLTATGRKVRGWERAELQWNGLIAVLVDIYRNGTRIATVTNSTAYTDSINSKGAGTYSYLVCAAGTQTCTNYASVTF